MHTGARVIISKPKYTQGGRSYFQDKLATVQSISGRFLVLLVDGELDEYGFFTTEVDTLDDSV